MKNQHYYFRIRICLVLWALRLSPTMASFNYQVEKRVRERFEALLNGPVETANVLSGFRRNGGFPAAMQAEDRNMFLALAYSVSSPLVYFGLEDGTCAGYYWSYGYYREPGNAGYSIDNVEMQKHFQSCIDGQSGEKMECRLMEGSMYIACDGQSGNESGRCEQLAPCSNQTTCSENDKDCLASLKWCRQYTILKAESSNQLSRGYIPLTNFCHDDKGRFSQQAESIIDPFGDNRETETRVDCQFGDGTLVLRNEEGSFAACGGQTCDDVFNGGYSSTEYDPRYRPWYINTRNQQKPNWTPPFAFFTLGLGITYAAPIYSVDEATGRDVFEGVIAVDYRLEDIANFLVDGYGKSDTTVLVYEVAEPNYMIASSTGSPASMLVLSEDPSVPCPVDRGENTGCEPRQVTVDDFGAGHEMDPIMVKAAMAHRQGGYPQNLVTTKAVDDDPVSLHYVSQSTIFSHEGTELLWRIIILEPAIENENDAILMGSTSFDIVCGIAALGCIICTLFAIAIYRRRSEKAIIFSDWRFTTAFIIGCILLNMSNFTLLGENTEAMCLLRMWSFHLCFAVTLSPLFVKVWRMYKLVGSTQIRRMSISNIQAFMWTLPMVCLQMILLLIFTIVDPPRPMDYIEEDRGSVVYSVSCNTNSGASRIVFGIYEGLFVILGCFLAYLTRNLQGNFGEAKQMIFSMYNILFVGLIVIVVMQLTGLAHVEESILQSFGVFWATIVSAGAFAIPRLLQAKENRREEGSSGVVHVSGMNYNTNSRLDPSSIKKESSGNDDNMGVEGPFDQEAKQTISLSGEFERRSDSSLSSSRITRVNFAGDIEEKTRQSL